MKLPIQAQPVMRILGMKISSYANKGILASGECSTGSWCCNVNGSSKCYPCGSTIPFIGSCLETAAVTCGKYGGTPAADCQGQYDKNISLAKTTSILKR